VRSGRSKKEGEVRAGKVKAVLTLRFRKTGIGGVTDECLRLWKIRRSPQTIDVR